MLISENEWQFLREQTDQLIRLGCRQTPGGKDTF